MNKPILSCKEGMRVLEDPSLKKIHGELILLGLVAFDSGYASLMIGLQLTEARNVAIDKEKK
jgi:hypothetical protein